MGKCFNISTEFRKFISEKVQPIGYKRIFLVWRQYVDREPITNRISVWATCATIHLKILLTYNLVRKIQTRILSCNSLFRLFC